MPLPPLEGGGAGRRLCFRYRIEPDPCLSEGDLILKDPRELQYFNSGFCEEEVAQYNCYMIYNSPLREALFQFCTKPGLRAAAGDQMRVRWLSSPDVVELGKNSTDPVPGRVLPLDPHRAEGIICGGKVKLAEDL